MVLGKFVEKLILNNEFIRYCELEGRRNLILKLLTFYRYRLLTTSFLPKKQLTNTETQTARLLNLHHSENYHYHYT